MKVLTRYLLRAHIGPFLFAFVALTGVILVNTLAKELANLAGKGLPMRVVMEFFVLSLPANIALTLPMAVLVAVLYTFSTLGAENELNALRASGVDLRRAALPVIAVAALIAGAMIWFNDRVLPASNYRWRVLMTDVAQARPLLALREQTINPIRTGDGTTPYYLEADRIVAETGLLHRVSIYDVSNQQVNRIISADSGKMAFNEARTDLLLRLFDGDMHEVDFGETSNFQVVAFREQVMRMEGVSDRLQRTAESSFRTDRDMTVSMMRARIDTLQMEVAAHRDARETQARLNEEELTIALEDAAAGTEPIDPIEPTEPVAPETADFADVGGDGVPLLDVGLADHDTRRALGEDDAFIAYETPQQQEAAFEEQVRYTESRTRNIEYQIRELEVEIQKKYSIATATLVFVLIGIPVAARFPRGGIGMVIAVSLTVFGVYYVGLIGGETLGDEGYMPPRLAMWLTNIVFGTLGLIGFLRLGHEQGSSRGNGWGEYPTWLRLPWRRRSGGEG